MVGRNLSQIVAPIPHTYRRIQGNEAVMASNSYTVPFAHAEFIQEGTEQQGGGAHVCSNYKTGNAGDKHKIKRGHFNFLRRPSIHSHHNNNNTGGEVIAEAIDIVAATRADRIWISWNESCNSFPITEPATAPTSPFEDGQNSFPATDPASAPTLPFEDGQEEQQQW